MPNVTSCFRILRFALRSCATRIPPQSILRFWLATITSGAVVIASNAVYADVVIRDSHIDIDGMITERTSFHFQEALNTTDVKIRTVRLDSPGGNVYAALTIAQAIATARLNTYIPRSAECLSACSLMYFAGYNRQVDGRLGVHQFYAKNNLPDGEVQKLIADILRAIATFDVDEYIVQMMLNTPPNEMYVFSRDEIDLYQIERTRESLEERRAASEFNSDSFPFKVKLEISSKKVTQYDVNKIWSALWHEIQRAESDRNRPIRAIQINKNDLNRDGVQDFIVLIDSDYSCGTAGCSSFVLIDRGDRFEVDHLALTGGVDVLSTSTRGYQDLLLGRQAVWTWNGSSYDLAHIVRPDERLKFIDNSVRTSISNLIQMITSDITLTAQDIIFHQEFIRYLDSNYPSVKQEYLDIAKLTGPQSIERYGPFVEGFQCMAHRCGYLNVKFVIDTAFEQIYIAWKDGQKVVQFRPDLESIPESVRLIFEEYEDSVTEF